MTLEQQVASLVTATTDLTAVVNTELNKVRAENTTFKTTVVSKPTVASDNYFTLFDGTSGNSIKQISSFYVNNLNYTYLGGLLVGKKGSNTFILGGGTDNTGVNTTGIHNTIIGSDNDFSSNTTGRYNVGLGTSNFLLNTTGNHNIGIGVLALSKNTIGNQNVGVGSFALNLNTEGGNNVAVGMYSLNENTIGLNNTAVGFLSLSQNTTGTNNTAVGMYSLNQNGLNNCSGLGYGTAVSGSNQVQLGDSLTTTYVFGTVQNRSDIRDKTDVRNTILGLDFIKSLRPVDYRWDMREDYKPVAPQDPGMEATDEQKAIYQSEVRTWLEACKLKNIVHNGTKKRNRFHHGLIAQEVKDVLTQKGIDFGGYQDHSISGGDAVLSLGYDQFIAPLIKAVQELSAQNEALIARISALESNLK
jgi:hypothetical protein